MHEMAITRHVPAPPAPQMWSKRSHLAGGSLIKSPQMAVLGQLGRGMGAIAKAACARWLHVDAMRRTGRPVVVLDEAANCKSLDLSAYAGRPIDPLTFEHALSSSPRVTGEW